MKPSIAARSEASVQLWAGMSMLLALALPALVGHGLDFRLLNGVNVWDKPLKFDLSLSVHLATLLVLLRVFEDEACVPRVAMVLRRAATTVTACSVVEAIYITLQAARGRPSHYNRETSLENVLYYGAMGPGALAILAGTFAIGWLLWRAVRPGTRNGLRHGAALGLMLGTVLTLVAVVPLSAGFVDGPGHWVGGIRSDAQGLPLVGWATQGGDLRVPHFFATHLIQVLPIVGWLADRFDTRRASRWVRAAAAGGTSLVVFTLWQAASGRPLIGS